MGKSHLREQGPRRDPLDQRSAQQRRRGILLSAAVLGLTAIATQMLALREFLGVFSGNELTLGVILASWLLLTGAGCLLGQHVRRMRDPLRWLVACQLGMAVLPALTVGGIRLLRQLLLPGLMVGIGDAFWASLVLLAPFCLVSGFLLTVLSAAASERRDARQIGEVYVLDTLGGIVGGALFSLCLVHLFEPLQVATFLAALNGLAAIHLSMASRRRGLAGIALLILAAFGATVAWNDWERATARSMFPGLELIHRRSTPYGTLALTRQGGQIDVWHDGVPVGSTGDPVQAEETVHYALSQHPAPKDVLLVSGGVIGAHREVARHPVDSIECVELDPAVFEIVRGLSASEEDPRLRWIAGDARRLVRSSRDRWDAILMSLPDPSSVQLNRYYTVEFFREVRRALRPGGVFSFGLAGAENYASRELRLLASSIHRSLGAVFENAILIPGARQYAVASDAPLDLEIAARLERRGIATRYVREEYLSARLTPDRLAAAEEMVSLSAPLNRDLVPGSYHAHLRYWMGRFGSSALLPALLVLGLSMSIAALLFASARRAVPAALCASGFAGMGLEVALLIAFQVAHGYLYQQIGLIITAFMAGAAVGAILAGRSSRSPARLVLGLDAALVGLSLLFAAGAGGASALPPIAFVLLNGAVGFAVGGQFPPGARMIFRSVEETAARLWTLDLLGACLGAILVGAFLVPLVGIGATCAIIAGIKALTAAALWARRDAAPGEAELPRPEPGFRELAPFGLMLLVLVGTGMAIVAEDSSTAIYGFSFRFAYHWVVVGLLAWGILRAMGLRIARGRAGGLFATVRSEETTHPRARLRLFEWASFLGLALVTFFPIFRCYFSVPYLFCHVCPRRCVFGYLRPYLVPAALIMNLERSFWCYHACPIGTLSLAQGRACRRSRRVPALLRALSLLVLVFTAVSYFKLERDLAAQPDVENDWYTWFFTNTYAVSITVIASAAVLILATVRLRRAFCEILCPIGRFSDLVLRLEGGLFRRGSGRREKGEDHAVESGSRR